MDLEHVLCVLLAGAREVEGAGEDDVVGDDDLRVHEVVHRARPVGRRRLAGEVAADHPLEQWQLPRDIAVLVPLVDDALDLRRVQAPRDIELPLRDELRQRREHRRGGDHGRADPHPLFGARDLAGDPCRQVLAVPRREPRADE